MIKVFRLGLVSILVLCICSCGNIFGKSDFASIELRLPATSETKLYTKDFSASDVKSFVISIADEAGNGIQAITASPGEIVSFENVEVGNTYIIEGKAYDSVNGNGSLIFYKKLPITVNEGINNIRFVLSKYFAPIAWWAKPLGKDGRNVYLSNTQNPSIIKQTYSSNLSDLLSTIPLEFDKNGVLYYPSEDGMAMISTAGYESGNLLPLNYYLDENGSFWINYYNQESGEEALYKDDMPIPFEALDLAGMTFAVYKEEVFCADYAGEFIINIMRFHSNGSSYVNKANYSIDCTAILDVNGTSKEDIYYMVNDIVAVNNNLYILISVRSSDEYRIENYSAGALLRFNISESGLVLEHTWGNGGSLGLEPSEYRMTEDSSKFLMPDNENKQFFGPIRFLAISPKKLWIADDGFFAYEDEIEGDKRKTENKDRIVVVDLEYASFDTVYNLSSPNDEFIFNGYISKDTCSFEGI